MRTDVIESFNSTSKSLDDLLNIYSSYCEQMVNHIYPPEIQLNKAISLIVKLSLDLSIINGIVSSKIYVNGMILILIKLILIS